MEQISWYSIKTKVKEWLLNSDSKIARFIRPLYKFVDKLLLYPLWQKYRWFYTIGEMQEISEILSKNNCIWSLQTCNILFYQRHGKLHEDQWDIDIAVLAENWHVNIEEEIRQKGFKVSVYSGGYYQGSEGVHIIAEKRGLPFEIYPAFKGTWDNIEYRWYGGTIFHRYYFEPSLLEQTKTIKYYGFNVEITGDIDTYLKAIYGDNYMIPIPDEDWDWENAPKCRLRHLKPTYLSQVDVDNYLGSIPK